MADNSTQADPNTSTSSISSSNQTVPEWLKQTRALAEHEENLHQSNEVVQGPLTQNIVGEGIPMAQDKQNSSNITPEVSPQIQETAPSTSQNVVEQSVAEQERVAEQRSTTDQNLPSSNTVAIDTGTTNALSQANESTPSTPQPVESSTVPAEVPVWLKALHNAQDVLVKSRSAGFPEKLMQPAIEQNPAEQTSIEQPAIGQAVSEETQRNQSIIEQPQKEVIIPSVDKINQQTPSIDKQVTAPTKPLDKKAKAQAELEERKKLLEIEQLYQQGMTTIRDVIAPASMEIRYDMLRIEGMYAQSFYVYAYPRYLETNWLAPIINFDVTLDVSQFIYPIDSATIMKVLKKKVAQMQASVRMAAEKGMVSDPALETALQDAEELRMQIQRGQEKFFQFALYFTIYSEDEKKIVKVAKQLESMLGGKLVLTRKTELQMEHGFNSCLPLCLDELEVTTNMNTSPLSTTFPFSSSDLTSNEGILYGLNRHNDSLIIFDRFSLENANAVVFAKSGAGKSYAVKLEILRSLMLDTDVIVIDPENEYEALAQTVGGTYLRVSLTSDRRINPFDLPSPLQDEEVQPGDLLRGNIITLHGLLKIMLGGVTPEEEGILDKALIDVYAIKGITMDLVNPAEFPPPTMEDLQDILSTMEGGQSLAQRLQKYTTGTYSGIFNKPTNVDLKSGLMVFCIRDLEDALRPIAMYIILHYIWNRIRSELKRRILVIDEGWTMMQYEDSAKFLFGLVKRARKYYLGITTITQDVEDFIKSPYGKPVVTNSSLQLLLKQAPAAIDMLGKVFNLTEGEKYMLLNSGVGQGLFFAGLKHVAIQIIASYTEDKIVTTNPEDLLRERERVE